MIATRVKQLLDARGSRYELLPHREVFTAQEIAATSHIPGRRLAKVIIAREHGGGYLMAVLPAPCRVDVTALRRAAGTARLSLASERELNTLFPDCDTGAMPPFGNLYALPVYVDRCFPDAGDLFFQCGNHRQIVRIDYDDFARLVNPIVGEFCLHARESGP